MLARWCGLVQGDDVKKHRFVLFAVAACFILHAPAGGAAAAGWLDDYQKAQQEAKASNKLLLLNFTGSDWCGWCIKLDKDVLSQAEFKDYASKNLVLMEVDFPWPGRSRWQEQAAELKKQVTPMNAWGLAEVYTALGEKDEALRWLEAGFELRFSWMPWIGVLRPFEPLRGEPRFQELRRRMNLPQN